MKVDNISFQTTIKNFTFYERKYFSLLYFYLKYGELTIFWHCRHLYFGVEWEAYGLICYFAFKIKGYDIRIKELTLQIVYIPSLLVDYRLEAADFEENCTDLCS